MAADRSSGESNGDILVIDRVAKTVSRYHSDGTPHAFSALGTNTIDGKGTGNCPTVPADCDQTPENVLGFGNQASEAQVAIDNSGTATDGNIYVTQPVKHLVDVFGADGHYLGQLTKFGATNLGEACGVAVDGSGNVFVGDYDSNKVHKYVPTANPPVNTDVTESFTSVEHPCNLAVGQGASAGFLFVNKYVGPVYKVDISNGELKYTVTEGNNTTVSVDPTNGHLLVATGSEVQEDDVSGSSPVISVVEPIKPGSAVEGVTLSSTGNAYLSRDEFPEIEAFGPPTTSPKAVTEPPSNVAGTSATLNGTVSADSTEVDLTDCHFEYGATTSYGQTTPCVPDFASIPTDESDHPVTADLTDLTPGSDYHYRLVAANAQVSNEGDDEGFHTLGPALGEAWVQSVTDTEAALRAKIDPEGKATTFHIEYGASEAYGQETPELPVGSDSAVHEVSAFLAGLTPGVTYHWSVVATNPDAENIGPDNIFTTYAVPAPDAGCPNQAFRAGPAAALPDCRAYEMVSPVDKGGGDIVATASFDFSREAAYRQSSPGGDKLTYTSKTAFGDAQRGAIANQYLAHRDAGAEEWISHGLNPPQGTTVFDPQEDLNFDVGGINFLAFTEDLCGALVRDHNLTPLTADAIHGFTDLYLRDNCGPGADTYRALTVGEAPAFYEKPKDLNTLYGSFAREGGHIVFGAIAALDSTPPAAETTKAQIYDSSNGGLALVSVLPGGEAATEKAAVGSAEAGIGQGRESPLERAVSEDGSRIFWTSAGNVYVRIDGEETVPVSEPVASAAADFLTASTDGSKAVFSFTPPGSESTPQLYEFDVDTETATKIAGEAGGVVGSSEDLSYLYFTSKEDLAPGADADGFNLYLRRPGGEVGFIATLSPQDRGSGPGSAGFGAHIDSLSPIEHASKVTPDGQTLAFMSTRPLTGYDNTDTNTGEAVSEVFLYDAGSETLACASCNPSGARPAGRLLDPLYGRSGNATLYVQTAAWLPTWEWSNHGKRALSEDGSHLLFNAYDDLALRDTNGVQDVYQWEASGSGGLHGCHTGDADYSPQNKGCLSLISTGQSPADSELVDASADGRDIFFTTASSIDPRDRGNIDIYDARAAGGLPPPAPEPPPCLGDACQAVPTPPAVQTPASASYSGLGDPAPRAACHKGKVRRQGRCIAKKQRKQHKRAKRHRRRAGREGGGAR